MWGACRGGKDANAAVQEAEDGREGEKTRVSGMVRRL